MEATTTKSIIIGAEPAEVYRACAEPELLFHRLKDVRAVDRTGDVTSRWIADTRDGGNVEWQIELTKREPHRRIAWSSTDESSIKTSGQLTFNPMPHEQTELTLVLKVVTNDGAPRQPGDGWDRVLDQNLRALKSSIESDNRVLTSPRNR
jgi:uncharacterized membrane protein